MHLVRLNIVAMTNQSAEQDRKQEGHNYLCHTQGTLPRTSNTVGAAQFAMRITLNMLTFCTGL